MTPKEQLIDALWNNRYKQGDYYLNQNGRHSVLGVVCELYGELFDLRVRPRKKFKDEGIFEYGIGNDWSCDHLIQPVYEWLGSDRIGSLKMPDWFEGSPSLMEIDVIEPHNHDSPIRSFREIAELLEDAEFIKTVTDPFGRLFPAP